MRKILSLVLVLSMVLGSFGFAFAAPADVEGTDFEDAVTRLSALEILSGYADGTFKPEKTITRAEFAKIMANALGVGTAAQYANGATKFADVSADHWAAGYINVVSDMKIVNGYGDGNFGPENQVTYAEAITMIVRALGYEPKAQAIGGYPGGYIAIGAEEDITDDVNVINTLAATRGDVALMVDAALDVPLMYQKTWGQYPEYSNDDEDKTLLTEKLGVDEVAGRVVAIPNTDSTIEENEIKILKDSDAKVKTFELLVDANYDSLLGLEVTVWADGSDVFFLDIDTDSDDIMFDTAGVDSTDKVINLYVEDDDFDWDADAKAYLNFGEVDLDEIPANAYGYVVLDSNDEVAYANFFEFDEIADGVVTEVEDDQYTYYDGNANDTKLEFKDYDDGVFIYTDKFVKADADIIDVDSAIFAWETSDELYLVVKNDSVSGTLDRVKAAEIRVDGEDLSTSIYNAIFSDDAKDSIDVFDEIADLENLDDEAVKVVLDLNGDAFLIVGESEATSSTIYGIVTYATVGKDADVTVFTKDGEEVDYTGEDRADFSGIDYEKDTFNYLEADGLLTYATISFKLNSDGQIDDDSAKIVTVNGTDNGATIFDTTGAAYGVLNKTDEKAYVDLDGVRYYVSEDTTILQAANSDGKLDPSVVKYQDFVDMAITTQTAIVYGDAHKDADMIVFVEKGFQGSKVDYYYGVVTDDPWKDGSDYVVSIDVFDGEEKEYVVDAVDTVGNGDLIAFSLDNDDEVVVEALYDLSEARTAETIDDAGALAAKDIDGTDVLFADSNATVDGKYLENNKMYTDAVVYELSSTYKLDDEVGYNRIGTGDEVVYLIDEDEKIVAALIWAYNDPTPVDPNPVLSELKVVFNGGSENTVADNEVHVNVTASTTAALVFTGGIADDKTVTATAITVNGKAATVNIDGTFTFTSSAIAIDITDLPEIPVTIQAVDGDTNKVTETFTIIFTNVPEL